MFKDTIKNLKAAFVLFIARIESLTDAIRTNTATVTVNTAEQTELRRKLDVLVEHSHFLVKTKKRELERSGHRAE